MADIWKLEDMTRKGELKECNNRTCTSKLQRWGKGGKRGVNCLSVPLMGQGKEKRGIHSQFYEVKKN